MTEEAYEQYGQLLATHLPGGAAQFCYIEEVGDPKEVINAAKNALSTAPLLAWEAFDEKLNHGGRDNYTSLIEGSLAMLYKTDDSIQGRRAARAQARTALLTLLARMRQDQMANLLPAPGTVIENDRLPLERVGPIGANWYGLAVAFTWRLPLDSRF